MERGGIELASSCGQAFEIGEERESRTESGRSHRSRSSKKENFHHLVETLVVRVQRVDASFELRIR